MKLSFLQYATAQGFSQSWPLEVMGKVMKDLAKANPQSTVNDVPGPVAFLWAKGNPPAQVTVVTQGNETVHEVKGGSILWLAANSKLHVPQASGKPLEVKVSADGEAHLPKLAHRRPRPGG